MGLLDKFFANQKQKKDERDALCQSVINEVAAANQGIANLLNGTPGYIYGWKPLLARFAVRLLRNATVNMARFMGVRIIGRPDANIRAISAEGRNSCCICQYRNNN